MDEIAFSVTIPLMNSSIQKVGSVRINTLVAGVVLTLLCAWVVFSFFNAARDGLAWKKTSELRMISPDFEARDTASTKKVPDFTLYDRYGNKVSLHQFASVDVLLVNLWFSGCPACKTEIPSLAELDKRLSSLGRVALITITTDETWEEVAHFFPGGTDLRVLFDPEKKVVEGIFNTTKFPETFVLDKQRRIRARFDGERRWHSREMLSYIASFQ